MVHFPGKKGEMAVESTFSAGKCTKKAGKWFTFPGKKGEIVVESTFSAGKCTKKAGKWFTFPKRRMWNTVGSNNANHTKTRDGKNRSVPAINKNPEVAELQDFALICPFGFQWELRESNPRPSACKADALNQLS